MLFILLQEEPMHAKCVYIYKWLEIHNIAETFSKFGNQYQVEKKKVNSYTIFLMP